MRPRLQQAELELRENRRVLAGAERALQELLDDKAQLQVQLERLQGRAVQQGLPQAQAGYADKSTTPHRSFSLLEQQQQQASQVGQEQASQVGQEQAGQVGRAG